ncbi:MAG: hypothetical protein ACOYL3_26260 [Desulfuromonadaceae bacterium]
MNRFLLLCMVAGFCCMYTGCGNSGLNEPPNYVGVFKSVRSSNDKIVMITITKDDGVLYEATIDSLPIKGTWGQAESDQLGLIKNQLSKGNDTYFIDFSLSIADSYSVYGTAYRQ